MVTGFDMERFIEMALDEDVRDGDITSMACIPEKQRSVAIPKVKEDGVIA